MKRTSVITLISIIAAVAIVSGGWYASKRLTARISDTVTTDTPIPLPLASDIPTIERTPLQAEAYARFLNLFGSNTQSFNLVDPVDQFHARITKKPFGIYITPDTSPIENDKFTGYHTGVDIEFTDSLTQDIEVHAITDGTITYRGWMKGYGGVIVIRHTVNGVSFFALYGHMNADTLPPETVTQVHAGDRLGLLGDDHSQETDGVRKHLHFSIYTGQTMDYRGYVPAAEDLSAWLNPLDLY